MHAKKIEAYVALFIFLNYSFIFPTYTTLHYTHSYQITSLLIDAYEFMAIYAPHWRLFFSTRFIRYITLNL